MKILKANYVVNNFSLILFDYCSMKCVWRQFAIISNTKIATIFTRSF
jgi:uncharacterized Fe-S radical SAM superfamily protein PflX